MVKGAFLSRLLLRSAKKASTSRSKSRGISSSDTRSPSSSVTTMSSATSSSSLTAPSFHVSTTKKNSQPTEPISRASRQDQQQHILSLLKFSNTDNHATLTEQTPLYYLRLYTATVQKLKRRQITSMEKQRAVYHLFSCLVIQQELDRFEPEFEYVGRKPRKTRYISTLIDTPVDSITHCQHPVLEASKRKPFAETLVIIVPSSTSEATKATIPSSATLTKSLSFSSTRATSFLGYRQNKSNRSDPSLHLAAASYPQLHFSRSDTYLSFLATTEDEEDNIPLAILKTRRFDCLPQRDRG